MAKEAGDDDLGDVGGVGTTAGHTHHSEEQQGEETQFQNKCGRASHRERERESKRVLDTDTETGTEPEPVAIFSLWSSKKNRLSLVFILTPVTEKGVFTYFHALFVNHCVV